MKACRRVRTRDPTDVPNELATSLAPMPKAKTNAMTKPMTTIHIWSGDTWMSNIVDGEFQRWTSTSKIGHPLKTNPSWVCTLNNRVLTFNDFSMLCTERTRYTQELQFFRSGKLLFHVKSTAVQNPELAKVHARPANSLPVYNENSRLSTIVFQHCQSYNTEENKSSNNYSVSILTTTIQCTDLPQILYVRCKHKFTIDDITAGSPSAVETFVWVI